MQKIRFRVVERIEAIGETNWQRCAGNDYPFTRYEFLHALETAGEADAACTPASGWQPRHLVISDGERVIAVMPMYLKQHSYGEYIFDWAWAEAYQRNGLAYYPKLLAAIPFTPATGPRLAIDPAVLQEGTSEKQLLQCLGAEVPALCSAANTASFHLLYAQHDKALALAEAGLLLRHSFQYHWFNRDEEGEKLASFDHFCGTMKARKRKAIRRERRDVQQQDIVIERLAGAAINTDTWHEFYTFYQLTYAKRSGHGGYLPEAFFHAVGKTMPAQIMLVVARKQGRLIAAALNFYSSSTLFGRYWGCIEEAEFLHFELCYYQGIEFCIERGLEKFDAGAQGEHKIQRGFRPVDTWSLHWIAREDFRRAIAHFIEQERGYNRQHMQAAAEMLPFRKARAELTGAT